MTTKSKTPATSPKGAMAKIKAGAADSGKEFGGLAAGFYGANALSKMVIKKDNPKVNFGAAAVGFIGSTMTKNKLLKGVFMGLTLFFGTKGLNNLTNTVDGLSGVPQGVKDTLKKVIPNLGETGSDGLSNLTEQELRYLQGTFGNPGGEVAMNMPVQQPQRVRKLAY